MADSAVVRQTRYRATAKGRAAEARYGVSLKRKVVGVRYRSRPDDRRNTLRALREVKARLAQKRTLMHELQSQLAELEVPA